jgi:VWFA-related protein
LKSVIVVGVFMNALTNFKRTIRWVAWLAAVAMCVVPASSQTQEQPAPPVQTQASSPAEQQPAVVIRKESKLVLVDSVVTDKKGNYIRDLTQNDFKVFEDNKEQQVSTFSTGADAATQANGQRRYLILFFDNSTMAAPDQIQARNAAKKFIEANAGPDRLMAVVDFGGSLRIVQNFTANAQVLQAAVSGVKTSSVDPNAPPDVPVTVASSGLPSFGSTLGNAAADFGARSMLLAVRSLAKNLRSIPGRKMVVLFSGGFPLTQENQSELTATIDACNKSNVAVYALDARGLVATAPGGSAGRRAPAARTRAVSNRVPAQRISPRKISARRIPQGRISAQTISPRPRLILAAFPAMAMPDPQRPGGGGGTGGGGTGGGGGRGGTGGGGTGGGGTGGGGGRGGTGGGGTGGGGTGGGKGGTGGGTGGGGTRGGTGGGGTRGGYNPTSNYNNSPFNQPRTIVPQFPPSATTNQQILAALAEGTGGFTIFNTNDLLGGLERIGKEQNEFYILGYVPGDTPEGSCHTLKVKLNRGGLIARSRSGYCNTRSANVLEGKPLEKQLESHATGSQPGSIHGALEVPYFYTAPDTARVNLAMEIPSDTFQFNKDKGKYHANLNVLGIAYRQDGTVGARFSDTVNLDLEKDDWKEFTKLPYRYENQFDATPGTYRLTVVLSAGGDAFGKFESPLAIDPYDGKHFSLSGVALTNSPQRLNEISTGLDSVLLEDRTPLVVKGTQIVPSGSNRFKHTDNVVLYTEIYEPLLAAEKPPIVAMGYRILERSSNKQIFFTDVMRADDYIQKGNPVIPIGLKVKVDDLKPGSYRLVMQAVDSAKNHAPDRSVDFDIAE